MQSSLVGRVVLGIAAIAAAVVLLIVLSDSDGDDGNGGATTAAERGDKPAPASDAAPASQPTTPTIVVRGGKPVGGVEELTYDAGERIRFAVRSGTEDEVHVHGYDIEKEVAPGRTVEFDFPATIEGVFEAELHESGEQIAELRIEP